MEEGVGLAAPVLHQFVMSRRRTTDVAVGKGGSVMWDAEGVQDQSDAFHHVARASAVNLY